MFQHMENEENEMQEEGSLVVIGCRVYEASQVDTVTLIPPVDRDPQDNVNDND